MDPSVLEHCLTDEERQHFNEQGYLIVQDALPKEMLQRLLPLVDRHYEAERQRLQEGANFQLNLLEFVGREPAFVELVDWPRTFAKVWGLLGWNIFLYHSHMIVNPHQQPEADSVQNSRWHQDSQRLNFEMETHPRPRLSLKVAFFLTDLTEPGRGNFTIIPGSHLQDELNFPPPSEDGSDPAGAMQVCVPPGTAVFFDRRLWHYAPARPNRSQYTRKALFYGYSYRWLRPKDAQVISAEVMASSDPIRRQLFGATVNNFGYYSPTDDDVPLRAWLRIHRPEDAC